MHIGVAPTSRQHDADDRLLVPAATAPSRRAAGRVRSLLEGWGIPASVALTPPARTASTSKHYDVLVFLHDADAACLVLTTLLPDAGQVGADRPS